MGDPEHASYPTAADQAPQADTMAAGLDHKQLPKVLEVSQN